MSELEGKISKSSQHKLDITRAYAQVFSSEEGNLVLQDLMENGFMMRPTCQNTVREGDALRNEGKRELVLLILEKLNTNYSKLLDKITQANKSQEEVHDEYY